MSQFIVFPEEMADFEVGIEITAGLREVVSILHLINFGNEFGLEDVSNLDGIYNDIMMQLSQYGTISDREEDNND